VIGSTHTGKLNYAQDEHFWGREAVPNHARDAVAKMTNLVDPDHLGLRKRDWNISNKPPRNAMEEQPFERKLINVRMGLLDQPHVKMTLPKIEPGCDLRNDYTGWNVSTAQNLRERRKDLDLFTKTTLTKHKMKNESIYAKGYKTPTEKTAYINEKWRSEKEVESELRDKIRSQYRFDNPVASGEKVDGAVFRLTFEHKTKMNQKSSDNDRSIYTFKPNLSRTLKLGDSGVTKTYYHTGSYQPCEDLEQDEEGKMKREMIMAWSCCMNPRKESQGCNCTVKSKALSLLE